MKKRIKMSFYELAYMGGGIYNAPRATAKVSGVEYRGIMCKMGASLTQAERDKILSFQNTRIYTIIPQYAPELASCAVFLADKCIK